MVRESSIAWAPTIRVGGGRCLSIVVAVVGIGVLRAASAHADDAAIARLELEIRRMEEGHQAEIKALQAQIRESRLQTPAETTAAAPPRAPSAPPPPAPSAIPSVSPVSYAPPGAPV